MSEKKHSCCKNMWLMILCCALPLLAVAAAWFFGYQGYLINFVWLLCPLMHGLMMWWMLRKGKEESA
ncbi:MAG TPA: hypothetical protein VN462_05890 [Negativicutes bacterium]|nr:hypothetical protein [Negativicutes bacterium]